MLYEDGEAEDCLLALDRVMLGHPKASKAIGGSRGGCGVGQWPQPTAGQLAALAAAAFREAGERQAKGETAREGEARALTKMKASCPQKSM